MRSDGDRLLDILDAMDAIDRRAVTKKVFDDGYFDVDWDEVWNVVERDITPLRVTIKNIVESEITE